MSKFRTHVEVYDTNRYYWCLKIVTRSLVILAARNEFLYPSRPHSSPPLELLQLALDLH